MIDFWVQLRGAPAGEFWMVEGLPRPISKGGIAPPERHCHLYDFPVRYISRADLIGWAEPIGNWARIIAYLVSHRRYLDGAMNQPVSR